ncbi:MAG TPA: hypothetical protein VGH16_22940, partial [Candidatus Binatia bacterium]
PEDEREARAVVDRVHEQIRDENYSAIYNESAQRFKSVGPEFKFLEVMRQYRTETGTFKKVTPVAYEVGVDSSAGKIYVFVDEVEFEKGRVRERLTLTRSESGKMQLWKLDWSSLH